MNAEHVAALARVEVRRKAKRMLRVWLVTLALVVAMGVWEVTDTEFQVTFLVALGLGATVGAALRVAEDKLNGQMEFLVRLPTAPSNLVAARFAAVAAHGTLWAVTVGAALWSLGPDLGLSMGRARLASAAALAFWAAASATGWVFVALFVLFDLDQLTGWPLVVAMIFVLASDRLVALVPEGASEWLLRLATEPWAPEAAVTLAVALFLAVAAVAFRAAEWGLARYEPPEERV